MTVSHVADDFYQGAVPAILPFLVVAYHYNYVAVTGITLAATVISSVAQPVFGVLTDRQPMIWMPIIGMLIAAAGVAVAGWAPSYPWVWVAIAVSGAGVAAYHPEASRAARLAAGSSAQGMSWFALGGNLGFALAPVTVSSILVHTGLRGTALLFFPAVVVAVVVASLLRRLIPAVGVNIRGQGSQGRHDDWRSFGWLTVVVICRSIFFFGISSFLVLYIIHTFHQSPETGSLALTAFTAAGAIATITGGWMADKLGRLPTIRSGYALAVPGIIGLVVAPTATWAILAAVVCGIGTYIPFSVHTTLGQEYLPNRLGTASGVTLGLAVSAGGLFSPLFGFIADSHGVTSALSALTALPIIALLASIRLPETRHGS